MVGWVLAMVGFTLMTPVLRRISEYQHARTKRQGEPQAVTPVAVPVNPQDEFEAVTGDDFVFGGSIESAQEGAGTGGSSSAHRYC